MSSRQKLIEQIKSFLPDIPDGDLKIVNERFSRIVAERKDIYQLKLEARQAGEAGSSNLYIILENISDDKERLSVVRWFLSGALKMDRRKEVHEAVANFPTLQLLPMFLVEINKGNFILANILARRVSSKDIKELYQKAKEHSKKDSGEAKQLVEFYEALLEERGDLPRDTE